MTAKFTPDGLLSQQRDVWHTGLIAARRANLGSHRSVSSLNALARRTDKPLAERLRRGVGGPARVPSVQPSGVSFPPNSLQLRSYQVRISVPLYANFVFR